MILWSPITDKVKYTWDKKFSKEQLDELEEKGYFTRPKYNSVRSVLLVDKQLLKERESLNQNELLKNITCPVLLIRGEKDTSVSQEEVEKAMELLSEDSKLEIVENADHLCFNQMDLVEKITCEWFSNHLL